MPANLTPQYFEAEKLFRAAKTPADKIAALEEMLRHIPKHKGTDKLQADLKARLSKLKRMPQKKGSRKGPSYLIPREGAGQIALVGQPNSGKSSLVAALTKARPQVAAFPHTTREPIPGMMPYLDIAFQLIDLPPASADYTEPWLFDAIRRAELIWLVVSGASPLAELEKTEALLAEKKISLHPAHLLAPEEEAEASIFKTLLVATGGDRAETEENLEIFEELMGERWPVCAVSVVSGQGLDELGRLTFEALEIIRVYTKQPGKPIDKGQPYTLPQGSTVLDLAAVIHKEIAETFRHARLWGSSAFEGQTVPSDYVLAEGDIVEVHA